jgi:predicted amidophosphoribosyltransferase
LSPKKKTEVKVASLIESSRRYPGVDALFHVAYYHAARVGYQDIISRSVHDFKDGCEPQTTRWIQLAAPMVSQSLQFDVIVRALGSNEQTAGGTAPLDRLCRAIAQRSEATYMPERLTKTAPIRAMTTLGGRAARQKELEEVYRFDGKGLPADVRILMVDDLATTGATLEAICGAIHASLETAKIICFALARVEAQIQNAHVDEGYFLHGTPATTDYVRATTMETAKAPKDLRESGGPTPVVSPRDANQAKSVVRAKTAPPAEARRNIAPPDRLPANRRGLDTRVYVIGLVISLMLLGGTFLFPAKTEPSPPPPQFVELVTQSGVKTQELSVERRTPPQGGEMEGKPGTITVPSTGLRSNHSWEAKVLPRITIRNRERVEILRKFTSPAGPDWVQIRTKSGTVGWVMSSVVKQIHG